MASETSAAGAWSETDTKVLATAAQHSVEAGRQHDTAFCSREGWLCVGCDADYHERVAGWWAAGKTVVLMTVDQVVTS